jgi:hypothetical protein
VNLSQHLLLHQQQLSRVLALGKNSFKSCSSPRNRDHQTQLARHTEPARVAYIGFQCLPVITMLYPLIPIGKDSLNVSRICDWKTEMCDGHNSRFCLSVLGFCCDYIERNSEVDHCVIALVCSQQSEIAYLIKSRIAENRLSAQWTLLRKSQ